MSDDDAGLDRRSRDLLGKVQRVRDLERQKREAGRSSDEFHEIAEKVTQASRDVFVSALGEEMAGNDDSPRPEEREDGAPGDWTHRRDN